MNCQLLQWAALQTHLSPHLQGVLLRLVCLMDDDGSISMSQTAIAPLVKMGERQTRAAIKELVSEGMINRTRQGAVGRGRAPDKLNAAVDNGDTPPLSVNSHNGDTGEQSPPPRVKSDKSDCGHSPVSAKNGDNGDNAVTSPVSVILDAEFVDNSPPPYKGTGARAEIVTNIISYQDNSENTELVPTSDSFELLPEPKSKAKRGTPMTADWKPCEQKTRDTARELGIVNGWCSATLENFIDYWLGVPGAKGIKKDWDATFRNALRAEAAARRYVPQTYTQGSRNGQRTDRPDESNFIKPKRSRHIAALLGDEPDNSPVDLGRLDSYAIK